MALLAPGGETMRFDGQRGWLRALERFGELLQEVGELVQELVPIEVGGHLALQRLSQARTMSLRRSNIMSTNGSIKACLEPPAL